MWANWIKYCLPRLFANYLYEVVFPMMWMCLESISTCAFVTSYRSFSWSTSIYSLSYEFNLSSPQLYFALLCFDLLILSSPLLFPLLSPSFHLTHPCLHVFHQLISLILINSISLPSVSFIQADSRKVDGRRILVDVERGRWRTASSLIDNNVPWHGLLWCYMMRYDII